VRSDSWKSVFLPVINPLPTPFQGGLKDTPPSIAGANTRSLVRKIELDHAQQLGAGVGSADKSVELGAGDVELFGPVGDARGDLGVNLFGVVRALGGIVFANRAGFRASGSVAVLGQRSSSAAFTHISAPPEAMLYQVARPRHEVRSMPGRPDLVRMQGIATGSTSSGRAFVRPLRGVPSLRMMRWLTRQVWCRGLRPGLVAQPEEWSPAGAG